MDISFLKSWFSRYSSRRVIERVGSDINPMLEVVRIGDRLMLNAANANYSYGGLHRVFQKAFSRLNIRERKPNDVLILGFGAGSIASILQEELGLECAITAVEKDPEVVRLGQKHFNTGRFKDLQLVEADAVVFSRSDTKRYDLVVVDLYIDFEVPEECEQQAFINAAANRLKPGGMLLFNKMVYNHLASEQAAELLKKFRDMPGKTSMLRIKQNVVNRIIVYEPGTVKNDVP
jgi:precorrin-6B methylase 2